MNDIEKVYAEAQRQLDLISSRWGNTIKPSVDLKVLAEEYVNSPGYHPVFGLTLTPPPGKEMVADGSGGEVEANVKFTPSTSCRASTSSPTKVFYSTFIPTN